MTLTALLPTRDRPLHCERQLRFLRANNFNHRIIVLDASTPENSAVLRRACAGVAEYRHFGPEYRMADKLAAAVVDVATPYVVLIPDDDILLPLSMTDAMAFLDGHPDFAVAHGYFVGFRVHDNDIDFHRVIGFTPSIDNDAPWRRFYDLFRRYQSFYWGVFRTPIFREAVTRACANNVVLFRELTVMSTTILQGKIARLRAVYALRGTATSHAPLRHSNPLFFFLHDARAFFHDYALFRDAISAFARDKAIAPPPAAPIEQFLDLAYATYLGREVDTGKINHAVELALGDTLPAIEAEPPLPDWREPSEGDIVHLSATRQRRYIWRRSAMTAEPREEIAIVEDDMARVERQLDGYR